MRSTKILQIANITGFILVVVINILAVSLPIAGRSTAEISGLYPNLFVPAGYAFSIWSVIYLLLLIFVVRQARSLFFASPPPVYVPAIGWWFFLSCLANAGWILAWHYLQVPLSVGIMVILLGSLMAIYLRLDINYSTSSLPLMVRLPFSVYLGWITVATVANVTALLVYKGWDGAGLSEANWTVIMTAVATVIALVILWQKKDVAFIIVIIWAFVAILVKQFGGGNSDGQQIITPLYLMIALMIFNAVVRMLVRATSIGI